ncbi:hypothetical protein FQR65_LT01072 [Abscondita terminalis]|nr:hypothetical protein FQR65_LT01072 [Abscondita terminalis]
MFTLPPFLLHRVGTSITGPYLKDTANLTKFKLSNTNPNLNRNKDGIFQIAELIRLLLRRSIPGIVRFFNSTVSDYYITYRRVGLLTVELDYLPSSWITYRRVGLLTVELDYLPSSWITYRRVGLLTVELDYLPSSWITYRRVGLLTVELDYLPSSWITYRRVGLLTVELDYLPSSWITYRRVGLLTVELDYLPSSWITYRRVGLLTVELDYLPSSWITYRRVGLLTVELDYLPSSWITYRRVGYTYHTNCKKHWTVLRDGFRRNLKKRKSLGGSSTKKWKYEDEMNFLKPYLKERPISSPTGYNSSTEDPEPTPEDTGMQESEDDSVEPSDSFKKEKRRPHQNTIVFENEDEIDSLFYSLAKTVKKMDPYYRALAKARVCSIVSDLELQNLTRQPGATPSTSVSTQVPSPSYAYEMF